MTNKKNVMHWGTLEYHLEQVKKKFICMKKFFWGKKTCNLFPK